MHKIARFLAVATFGAALLAAGSAFAQAQPSQMPSCPNWGGQAPAAGMQAPGTMQQPVAGLSQQDVNFLQRMARHDLVQIKIARLAAERGATSQVRSLGQRMLNDKCASLAQLQQLAAQNGVSLPTQIGRVGQAQIDNLASLSGQQFDRQYLGYVQMNSRLSVALLNDEANFGTSPVLQQFAQNQLASARSHYDMAQSELRRRNL